MMYEEQGMTTQQTGQSAQRTQHIEFKTVQQATRLERTRDHGF